MPLVAGVAMLAPAAPAMGSTTQAPAGLSGKDLRAFESRTLGAQHAAEHAHARAVARSKAGRRAARQPKRSKRPLARAASAQVGRWGAPFPIPALGMHTSVLANGKVMFFSYPSNPSEGGDRTRNTSHAYVWDPKTQTSKRVDPPVYENPEYPNQGPLPVNIDCSGHVQLPDGRLLVVGGDLAYPKDGLGWKGLKTIYTYNPFNEKWTRQPDMQKGRWYPTLNVLPDGRVAIVAGLDETGNPEPGSMNDDIEVFTPSPDMDGVGTVTKVSERDKRYVRTSTGLVEQTGGYLNLMSGGYYPHMFVMPSGKTLLAGPQRQDSYFYDFAAVGGFDFRELPKLTQYRLYGSGVPYASGPNGTTRFMLTGGVPSSAVPTTPARNSEIFDETDVAGGWKPGPEMNVGRAHHNTVLLPDGSMVAVGGGHGVREKANEGLYSADEAHKQVELFDPATGTWRLGAAQAEKRAYHSTAVLLPDGRVLSAGDDLHGGIDKDTGEIYEPPYLFKGARPSISFAPDQVRWGARFSVGSPDGDVERAVLIAPGANTHAVDMNQRMVPLALAKRSDGRGVDLVAPPNANVAPPGYYMLFLVNRSGVPSEARFVRVHGAAPDAPAIPVTPGGSTGGPGTPGGSNTQKAVVMFRDTFERRKLRPWSRRAGTVAVTRGAKSGRYALKLRGRRSGATIERRLPALGAGRYRLTLSVRGALTTRFSKGSPKVDRVRAARRNAWRTHTHTVRITRRTTGIRLRLTSSGRKTTYVDDVRFTRLP